MKTKVLLGSGLALILCVLGWTGYARNQNDKTVIWEYKAVSSATKEFQGDKTFNELGAQGWELVTASGGKDFSGVYFVFKRRK